MYVLKFKNKTGDLIVYVNCRYFYRKLVFHVPIRMQIESITTYIPILGYYLISELLTDGVN